MFRKVLIANRGEIAVRIVRACRDLGIVAIAVFDHADQGSLHVRLADQAYPLTTPLGYSDANELLRIARTAGADAIHPGYGFLAEDSAFAQACDDQGMVFVGPRSACLALTRNKIAAIERVRAAGIATIQRSTRSFLPEQFAELEQEAEQLGYPLVVKSSIGGRGRGTRLVRQHSDLAAMVHAAHASSRTLLGDPHIYLEAAILPSRNLSVPLLGDAYGNLIHLGERDASIQRNNMKIIEETPAPSLSQYQREQLWQQALQIGRLFDLQGAAAIEFVADSDGQLYFTEIKARIQVEHSATEMLTRVDMVGEQLRIAAGLPLSYRQQDIRLEGVAIQCRINAEDPWNNFLPSPGRLEVFRLPGGPQVRIDTYAYVGCEIPVLYDPLLAKLVVWGATREEAIGRMRRALRDIVICGVQTNLLLLQRISTDEQFCAGSYTAEFSRRPLMSSPPTDNLADLAAIAAIAFVCRTGSARPIMHERYTTGWHRNSRRLPE